MRLACSTCTPGPQLEILNKPPSFGQSIAYITVLFMKVLIKKSTWHCPKSSMHGESIRSARNLLVVPETSGPKRAQVLRYCFEGVVCQCFLVRAHASTATSTSIPELNFSFQAFDQT